MYYNQCNVTLHGGDKHMDNLYINQQGLLIKIFHIVHQVI